MSFQETEIAIAIFACFQLETKENSVFCVRHLSTGSVLLERQLSRISSTYDAEESTAEKRGIAAYTYPAKTTTDPLRTTQKDELSEEFIGEWMQSRGIRDQIMFATKYMVIYKNRKPSIKHQVNYASNHVKSLNVSVIESPKVPYDVYRNSLRSLLCETSIQKIVNSLHILVLQGKVLYLGISDFPAWFITQANTQALQQGKSPFVIYQGRGNLVEQSFEREIIPMARPFGLALVPWDVLGGETCARTRKKSAAGLGRKGEPCLAIAGRNEGRTRRRCLKLWNTPLKSLVRRIFVLKTPYVFALIGGG
ncbi:NADP-dependent oxidoreductase domain-containing protein [Armillaria borealis]|uniref:NADP-dependent oxidoreductase domain-containing protein n=1 Tax=Armillaria borealis TaxID=47425 RepID=A0AA39ISR0_9AGAR|nr:NADP-dependent oxidoreductase domain-containing protein [Armillaria borealis]